VAVLNDHDIRVVKTKGQFTRHSHPDTDKCFLVLRGNLTIHMDTGDVERGLGPSSTVNTGDTSAISPRSGRSCSSG